jgi:hypothetical protein
VKLDKISDDVLQQIHKLVNDVDLMRNQLSVRAAELDLLIAQSLSSSGHTISTALICLSCGTIRSRAQQECLVCQGLG